MNPLLRRIIAHIIFIPSWVFLRSYLKGKLIVFLFHDVTNKPSKHSELSKIWISEKRFLQSLIFINKFFLVHNPINPLESIQGEHRRIAMITFDDCWLSIFRGIDICNKQFGNIPIMFINGGTIMNQVDRSAQRLHKSNKSSVTLTEFQGQLLTSDTLNEIDLFKDTVMASHLFNHDRALTLSPEELKSQAQENLDFLSTYSSASSEYFAFPHGAREVDFNSQSIEIIQKVHQRVWIFSADPGVNCVKEFDSKVLKRIHLTEENSKNLWIVYSIMRGILLNLRNRF